MNGMNRVSQVCCMMNCVGLACITGQELLVVGWVLYRCEEVWLRCKVNN